MAGHDERIHGAVPMRTVTVQTIDKVGGLASCVDDFGKVQDIPLFIRRAKGVIPQPGEVWVIDRAFGYWNFAAVLTASVPIVVGSRSSGTALANLLTVLASQGLIVDSTTP